MMVRQTRRRKRVVVKGDETLDLERSYVVCPACGEGGSPLDERLWLLPTGYSPVLVEAMARLGARLPFAVVAKEMAMLLGVSVSADTVRRLTEEAGPHLAAIEQEELERLGRDAPEDPERPTIQQVRADGCMVSLTDGRWTEVRNIGLGMVEQHEGERGAGDLTYYSRHGSADEFIRQAALPTS